MDAGRQAFTSAKLLLTSPSAMRTSFVGMTPVKKETERSVLLSAQLTQIYVLITEIPNRIEARECTFLFIGTLC